MQPQPPSPIRSVVSTALVAAALALAARATQAADTNDFTAAARPAVQAEMAKARQLIDAKQWKDASTALERVVAEDRGNADAFNLLGYSYRWQGRMDESFAAYDKALRLDPRHRGALNYSGIAYLKVGKPEVAERNLAKLQDICGAAGCEEATELASKIAEYRAAKK